MKKTIINICAVLSSVVLASSCQDFLEKAPILSQSTDITLSNYEGLNKATLGAYSLLASDGWYGGDRVLTSEMRSGNGMKSQAHSSNRYTVEMNWNYTADATSSQWEYSYVTISKANNVIDNLAGKESSSVSAQDLNNLKAECLFIRALAHFDCVTIYAQPYSSKRAPELGVPYVYHTDASGKPARDAVAKVYGNVVTDLLEAEKIIDPAYEREGVADPKAVVSLNAIRALLSRVYLYMENWDKAAEYASKVIDSNEYELYNATNYCEAWNKTVGGSEVIFEVYKDLTNLSNLDCSYMTYPGGAYGDCICSTDLYSKYEDTDIRKAMYCQDSDGTPGLYWTKKYAGKGLGTPDANNVVVLRLSEMYLNRAEATLKGANSGVAADKDLNAIAVRCGATAYTSAGMEDLMSERRKELAWEGHYFFDMARWGKKIVRPADAFLTVANSTIDFPSDRWALPISKAEIDVNGNLKQNPGY